MYWRNPPEVASSLLYLRVPGTQEDSQAAGLAVTDFVILRHFKSVIEAGRQGALRIFGMPVRPQSGPGKGLIAGESRT